MVSEAIVYNQLSLKPLLFRFLIDPKKLCGGATLTKSFIFLNSFLLASKLLRWQKQKFIINYHWIPYYSEDFSLTRISCVVVKPVALHQLSLKLFFSSILFYFQFLFFNPNFNSGESNGLVTNHTEFFIYSKFCLFNSKSFIVTKRMA